MKLKLVKKQTEANDARSFFFEPQEKVDFLPGQYFYITLPRLNYNDDRGPVRQFTISSSPTEGNLLRITTRIRSESGFKKTLDELNIGESADGQGPNGTFSLNNESEINHVFIAGGIGITPFRSIIKNAIDSKFEILTKLIYSNSNSGFVFKHELDKWVTENKWFSVRYHDSDTAGRLDTKMITKLTTNIIQPTTHFWLSGHPSFVSTMEEILNLIGINSEHVHLDKFTGY